MDVSSQPVQLRLGFAQPTAPVTMRLSLSGAHILVETDPGQLNEAWSYLSAVGATPTVGDVGTLTFPAASLPALAELPEQVHLVPEERLRTLLMLVTHPSADGKPAELTCVMDGSLWLSWFDGNLEHSEPFPPQAAVALLTAELPFVATAEAFDALRTACQLPLLVGRARVNLDGFVEISTSKPQMVESAPLPGLFRLDETHYGVGLPFLSAVHAAPGFVWEGQPPALERGPSELPPMPMPLSRHAAADLRDLVDNLAAYRAQAIVWSSGLGRRVFALAAVEALDAWPLLIVCPPAAVWGWQRHLDMFGKSSSLTHFDADAHLMTYHDLERRRHLYSFQTVIFDDLTDTATARPGARAALRRLDGLMDAYRISVSSTWPKNPATAVEVMSVLRPGEFRPDLPVAQRYPANADTRLVEHVSGYISSRTHVDPGRDDTTFRRSSVVSLTPSPAQVQALADARTRHQGGSAPALLAETMEILSAGPPLALSPKVPAAIARVLGAVQNSGRRVAVLTRHTRTATLVKAAVRATTAVTVEASAAIENGVPQARLVIVRFDRELPDLRWFDEVIVVDYPWSTALLDAAVGSAADNDGPLQVTFLHLAGTLDDRLAMLAARRREIGSAIDQTRPPSVEEMTYLLAPRPA